MARRTIHAGLMTLASGALLSACASLRPVLPEVFYKATVASAADTLCAELATGLMNEENLARDASYEISLGGSRCHEILYAQDGNEIWLQLRGDEFTIAVRYYPHPGDLEEPTASTQSLADAAVELLKSAHTNVLVERATERP
ncbi:MAG: hypothetical protein WB646_14380 [Steroidobacteraceae bacterium]